MSNWLLDTESDFMDAVWYVYQNLPDDIDEKICLKELKLIFDLELDFMKSKKLLIEGVTMSCYEECEGLNYFLRFNIVKYDLLLSEEEIDAILDLEESYYADCIADENNVSPALEDSDSIYP